MAHSVEVDLLRIGAWHNGKTPSPSLFGFLLTHLIAKGFPVRLDPPQKLEPIIETDGPRLLDMTLIALPGHSEGQIGFEMKHVDGSTAWIVGDVLMTLPNLRELILYKDRIVGLASIAKLARLISPGDLVCPGHGPARQVDVGFIAKLKRLGSSK